jgi:anti-anti-sigma factor
VPKKGGCVPVGWRVEGVVSDDLLAPVTVRRCGSADRVALVALRGDFDVETVPEIDAQLRRILGPFFFRRHLVLDLAQATFVDSTFIGYVVRLMGKVRSAGFEIVLARPTGHVRRTLLLVGLPNLLPVYDALDAALNEALADDVPIIPPTLPTRPPGNIEDRL